MGLWLTATSLWLAACSRPEPLPVLSTLPEFSLTASDGSTLGHADVRGKIWVVDFIYTQCPGVCPLLSEQMAKLAKRLGHDSLSDVQLLSVSVDPTHDTPSVMNEYATRFHADRAQWRFVTGPRDELYRLIGKGFLLAVAEETPSSKVPPSTELITHSDRFALVDRRLQVRGYYRPLEEGAMERLVADIERLKGED